RARSLHAARKAELVEEVPKRERCRAQDVRLILGWVEIEHTDVGVIQLRHARRPDMRRDAVLVGQPEQRSRIQNDWVVHRPALLRNFDALQPFGEAPGDVLLEKTLLADAVREP